MGLTTQKKLWIKLKKAAIPRTFSPANVSGSTVVVRVVNVSCNARVMVLSLKRFSKRSESSARTLLSSHPVKECVHRSHNIGTWINCCISDHIISFSHIYVCGTFLQVNSLPLSSVSMFHFR